VPDRRTHVTHVGRSSASSDGGPTAYDLSYPASGRQSRPPVAFPACASTRVIRRPPKTRRFMHPSRPRRRPIVQRRPTGGSADSPARRPVADGHCASRIALPLYPPPAVLDAPPPAAKVAMGPVTGQERRRVQPAINPSPPSRPNG